MFSRIFRIYKFTNFLQYVCFCFLLKQARIFLLRSKMLLILFVFTKRYFAAPFKEDKTFFVKRLRGNSYLFRNNVFVRIRGTLKSQQNFCRNYLWNSHMNSHLNSSKHSCWLLSRWLKLLFLTYI